MGRPAAASGRPARTVLSLSARVASAGISPSSSRRVARWAVLTGGAGNGMPHSPSQLPFSTYVVNVVGLFVWAFLMGLRAGVLAAELACATVPGCRSDGWVHDLLDVHVRQPHLRARAMRSRTRWRRSRWCCTRLRLAVQRQAMAQALHRRRARTTNLGEPELERDRAQTDPEGRRIETTLRGAVSRLM